MPKSGNGQPAADDHLSGLVFDAGGCIISPRLSMERDRCAKRLGISGGLGDVDPHEGKTVRIENLFQHVAARAVYRFLSLDLRKAGP